jgi:uncharacterized protein with GYD domain
MATYVVLKRAAQPGSLKELFADAADPGAQERAISELGGSVLFQAALAGQYDFILIADLPDEKALATVELQCNGRGFETTALRAYTPEEAAEAVGTKSADAAVPLGSTGALMHVFLKKASGQGSLQELLGDGADPGVQEKAIGALGGRVIYQAALAGVLDFVLVAELPDHKAVGYVCIQCNGARGVHTAALRTYTAEEAAGAIHS